MIEDLLDSTNKKQKKLLLILTPILFFFIAIPFVNMISRHDIFFYGFTDLYLNLSEAWFVWLIYFAITGFLEFKILNTLD